MNEFFAELRKRLIGQKFVLAVASMVFATVIALLQRWFGFPSVVFCIMPVITGALIWNQSKHVAGVAIFLAFLSVAILGFPPKDFERDSFSSFEQFLVSASGLIYIAFVLRFSTICDSQLGGLLTSRINYTPAQTFDESQKPMQGNNLSAGLLLVSWFVGWFLCGDLRRIQEDEDVYKQMSLQLRANIGLETPEIYLAMKLLITLMLLLWIANQLFSYWQLRSDSGSVVEMHLRSELWKWNGSEQRRISKQRRKNMRSLTTSKK